MADSRWQTLYREDAALLGQIGQLLVRAKLPRIEVRLPRDFAEAAVAAWEREGDIGGEQIEESCQQRLERGRAAALSLIGLSITERGRWDGDDVLVPLDPVFIGNAVDAADDLPPA